MVERLRHLQPFSQPGASVAFHPLVILATADNANKHRLGLTTGLQPAFVNTFLRRFSAAEFTLEEGLTPEQLQEVRSSVEEWVNQPPFKLTSWRDGDVVWQQPIPTYTLAVQRLDPLDIELAPVLDIEPEEHSLPAFPILKDALEWAGGAIRYLSGLQDSPPISTAVRRNPNAP